MIPITCVIPDYLTKRSRLYEKLTWPTAALDVPREGEWIESLDGNGTALVVRKVIHYIDRDTNGVMTPAVKVELGLPL